MKNRTPFFNPAVRPTTASMESQPKSLSVDVDITAGPAVAIFNWSGL